MSVNERLAEADLLDAFDAAVRAKNRDKLTEILKAVGIEEHAFGTINSVLANPARYGYPP